MVGAKGIVAASALFLAAIPATAQAQPNDEIGTGAGSVGAVHVVIGAQTTHADPIAPCSIGGTQQNRTDPVTFDTTKYGLSSTSCTRNADGTVSVQVSGARFQTTVLRQFGGPMISARTFKSGCNTTENGSNGSMELGAVTGITVPASIPPNYVTTIPGRAAGDPPMAEVVLNELIVPTPADGSLVTNAMHIKLFPQGGPASGDILVGSAACDPFGG
ncbi:choice-of-anchor P family protein [Amycolatopsis sp. GM8]|uniref:choice-of-anchor P family protein n=1 Tax=Amycolatopsis sp. GM8 TaxID=2896530 RepID=UPI001F3CE830|nr:choice-of-anchor P family protein [Amycolatopsis sp. GM8]